jgi:hypothetical protein
MTLSTFKKFDKFVNEELEKFYDDLDDSSKNYKVPVDLKIKDYEYKGSSMELEKPKKKETIKKVKRTWIKGNNAKNLF